MPDDQYQYESIGVTRTPFESPERMPIQPAGADPIEGVVEIKESYAVDSRTDEGRRPLIATSQGRAHTTTLRTDCYRYTRPCTLSGACPHGRDIDGCPATDYDSASECPSSVSPHAIRRGGITHALQQDWPMKAVSDRANVSEQVFELHYDQRSEKVKMEQRRDYLDTL
jgi:hypothetical protein